MHARRVKSKAFKIPREICFESTILHGDKLFIKYE